MTNAQFFIRHSDCVIRISLVIGHWDLGIPGGGPALASSLVPPYDAERRDTQMERWVDITFDCLPLRSVGRLDVPLDASPAFRTLCENIKGSIERHGSFNTYYVYNARCIFHLLNHPTQGMIEFRFEGTLFTDASDCKTERSDLSVELVRETCDWLKEPIVEWFRETVTHAVRAEFDRFIEAGDLEKARQRIEKMRAQADQSGGYMGMYL